MLSNPNSSLSKEELLLRLEEAEETLRAIRSGEVDALIVSSTQGEQIFTLKDASHPYQVLIEEMNEGALTLTSSGMILYCNPCFAQILGLPIEVILGESFFRFVVFSDQPRAKSLLEQGLKGNSRGELRLIGGQIEIPVGISLREIKLDGELRLGVVILDLTERKQAENEIRLLNATLEERVAERTQQLEFERARWQGIVEGIADEVWTSDAQGKLNLLNLGTATPMGFSAYKDNPVEDIYRDVDVFYPNGQPRPPEQSPLLRSLRGEIVRGEEIMRHRQTGMTRWRQFSSAPMRDENGAITGAVAIVRDITEQKHAEEGLHRFELLSQYSKDIVLFMDRNNGRILEANLAAEHAYGYTREELLSIPVRKLRAYGTRELTSDQVIQTDREGILFETIHQRKDGSTFPVEVSSQGAVIGGVPTLINIVRDITERKQAEAKLAYQADLLARVSDAVIGVDENLQISFWNAAAEHLFGWTAAEVMGRGTAQVFRTQFPGFSGLEAIQKFLETDEFDGEVRYHRKDNSFFIGHARSIVVRGSRGAFQGMVTTVRDITERKQAEADLQESQSRLKAVFAAIPYVIIEMDADLNPLMVNPAAEEAFGAPMDGLSPEQAFTKLKFRKLDGSVGRIEDMPTFRAARGETVSNALYKITTADGNERVISIYATPLYKDGKVNSVVALWHDLTERIRAEDALRESEERYRAVVEHALDAIIVTDPSGEGQVLSVNPAACRMFGYSMEELLQLKREDLLDTNDPNFVDYLQKRNTAKEIATELTYKRKDGSRFLGDISTVFFQDKNGELRAVAIIRDITERKQNEEAVQRSETLLRAVIDQMPSGVTVRDAQSGEILLSNPRSREILGSLAKTPGHFIQYRGFHSNGLPYQNEEWPVFRSITAGEIVGAEEINCVRNDGSRFALSINSAPIRDSQGKIVMGVAIFDDITERKQNEEQLSATLREKVVLLQEIHHRVKNNLQVISSLLRLQAAAQDDPKIREVFAESQRRVRAMALIHEQLYKSSSLAQINFKNYINELVHYLRRSFTAQAASGVEISVTIEDTDIEMDQAVPLGLLVSELVSNSLKHAFSSDQPDRMGKIWITARREPSEGLIVSIGDNGVGIPEKLDLEHSPSMGLQLVRSFVTQLQGQLTIQRKPGTVFTITIPERKD